MIEDKLKEPEMTASGDNKAEDLAISPQDAAELVRQGKARLIDIRETEEYSGIRIPGAELAPLSVFGHLPHAENSAGTAVYFCRSGRRTAANLEALLKGGFNDVRILDGGLEGWQKAGLPVEVSKTGIPIMRQVLIAAGLLVFAFSVVSLNFRWGLAGLFAISAGLVYAGVSGNCMMRTVLMKMPWNKN